MCMREQLFFRLQESGLSLEQMQEHRSTHGCDSDGEFIYLDGVAASDRCDEVSFGGSCETEVVVFSGHLVGDIYDGVVVRPEKIIARHSYDEWCAMVDTGATDMYE
jgi:hypothetical protein